MAITAKDVAKLRKRTGLGMMDCKKALTETDGDFDAAVEVLRKSVKGKMDERTEREATEGLVIVKSDGDSVTMVEINSESDFVARNDNFIAACNSIADIVTTCDAGEVATNDAIIKITDDLRINIQENISYARGYKMVGPSVGAYVHHTNKLGVIIELEGEADEDLITGLCQHVAATVPTPLGIDEESLPADEVDKIKQRAIDEATDSGKPAEIAEKMATGKLRKWKQEHTLLGQEYIRELGSKKTVADVLPKGTTIKTFIRYQIG